MKRAAFFFLHILSFFAALYACMLVTSAAPIVDLAVTSHGWFPLVHGITNEFHAWRLPPPLNWLLAKPMWTGMLVPLYVIVLLISSAVLIRYLHTLSASKCSPPCFWAVSCIAPIGIVWQFGRDTVILSGLAFFPLQIAALLLWMRTALDERCSVRAALSALSLSAIVTVVASFTANQLSFVVSMAAFWVSALLTKHYQGGVDNPLRGRIFAIGFSMVSVIGLFTCCMSPLPLFPDYPSSGRIVADDGLPGIIRPLIGSDYLIPTIDRPALAGMYTASSLWLLAIGVVLLLAHRASRIRSLLVISLSGVLLVVFDVVSPPFLSSIGPLQSLPRLVPGLAVFALTPIVYGLAWIIGAIALAAMVRMASCTLWFLAPAILVPWIAGGFHTETIRPGPTYRAASLELVGHILERSPSLISSEVLSIVTSPSLEVLREMHHSMGFEITDLTRMSKIIEKPAVRPPQAIKLDVVSSGGPQRVAKAVDGKRNSRWSLQTGKQLGSEWLLLRFAEPVEIDGVSLDTGRFPADFPRGLSVSTASECPELTGSTNPGQLSLRNEGTFSTWRGALAFTKSGFPYFGSQSDVRVPFIATRKVQCILAAQIGSSDAFDWSVSEVGIIQLSGTGAAIDDLAD